MGTVMSLILFLGLSAIVVGCGLFGYAIGGIAGAVIGSLVGCALAQWAMTTGEG